MELGLQGANVLVSGGTRGIGRAIARAFAAERAIVSICARDEADVLRTVADLVGEGAGIHGACCDVTDGEDVRRWVGQAAETLGGVDVVVANVSAIAMASDEATWRRSFETDRWPARVTPRCRRMRSTVSTRPWPAPTSTRTTSP